jgi:hypothetical protein
MDSTFLQARIDATKTQIIAFEGALTAFAANGALQSYTIDTGQTDQTVTRANLTQLRNTVTSLYNQLATLEARLTGGGSTQVIPGW